MSTVENIVWLLVAITVYSSSNKNIFSLNQENISEDDNKYIFDKNTLEIIKE